jgi:hypothetical protein
MSKRILKTPQSYYDLVDLAEYIARDNLTAAERFFDAAEGAFELPPIRPSHIADCSGRIDYSVG